MSSVQLVLLLCSLTDRRFSPSRSSRETMFLHIGWERLCGTFPLLPRLGFLLLWGGGLQCFSLFRNSSSGIWECVVMHHNLSGVGERHLVESSLEWIGSTLRIEQVSCFTFDLQLAQFPTRRPSSTTRTTSFIVLNQRVIFIFRRRYMLHAKLSRHEESQSVQVLVLHYSS